MARRARNTSAQGRAFENQIQHDLERYGYRTMRSAGSKGAADVVAFGHRTILFVQAKVSQGTVSPAERRGVLALADLYPVIGSPLTATKRSVWTDYRLLTGPGPKDWTPWEPEPLASATCAGCGHPYAEHGGSPDVTGCWGPGTDGPCVMRCPKFILRPPVGLDAQASDVS
jgi:hypothetical protein